MESSWCKRLTVVAAVLGAGFGMASCGGDPPAADTSGAPGQADEATAQVRTGGQALVSYGSYPDYLDPALSYTAEGWNTLGNVYTGLLTYRRTEGEEGSELVPGLARALPAISADGKTYRLRLRTGLVYSDGTPVKASDFEHTLKRALHLESGASAFYFGITGAERYFEAGRARGDIAGIQADDGSGKITIALTAPNGAFPYLLAVPFAGIVPGRTPFENASRNPPPGVGAYKLEGVRQGRGYRLARNERFPGFEGVPKPRLDSIEVEVKQSQRRATEDIVENRADWMIDPPPPDQLREVKTRYADRYEEYVTNSTYFFFLNTRQAPFDDKRVRQAVNFAVDKRALARLFGGLLEPSCNFLPPGMVGYEELDPCPYGDPNAAPQIEKARQLIADAGAAGTPVTVYGNDEDPARSVTEYLADVLDQIGLRAQPRILEASVYLQTIGNEKTAAQIGLANWFQDFPHPQNFFFLVDPESIQATNNQNLSNVEDPGIGRALREANRLPIERAESRYAEVDARLVEEAYVVPYGHRKLANFASERVDFERCTVTHPVYELDLAQLCLK